MSDNGCLIDTNVLIAANGEQDGIPDSCVEKAIESLEMIKDNSVTVLDDKGLILKEYMNNLGFAGQPGPGHYFAKWIFDNQANRHECEQVPITPIPRPPYFNEFPNDPALDSFDKSDRKFAAAAISKGGMTPIKNATDSDWWIFENALKRNKIQVQFICPEIIKNWKRRHRKIA